MKNNMIAFLMFLLVSLLLAAPTKAPDKTGSEKDENPVGISFIPEMDFIAEVDSWTLADTGKDVYAKDLKAALHNWESIKDWTASKITPPLVRSLSRWAKKEMTVYKKAPTLSKKITLTPVRKSNQDKKLLFEATLDTLPTHSSLVTRWLKLYLLYDQMTEKIVTVTITIRGEILE